MTLAQLTYQQHRLIKFWLPALVNGAVVWALLLLIGQTPLIRASGLALVIVGVTLALRRMGAVIAVIGGLTLALSPVFWSQTGGGVGSPATIVIAVAVASVAVVVTIAVSKRPYIGLGLGVLVFAAIFWSQIGTPRSIRLTSFIIGWLMFVLVDMLLITNPRPDEAPLILRDDAPKNPDGSQAAQAYHTLGILLLLSIGILNDPLLSLLAPSIGLSLYLTRTKLPLWYWLALGLVFGFGLYGIYTDYIIGQAHRMMLWQWRDGVYWIDMVRLLNRQFTIIGIVLGILGLARLARWYPPLGTVAMIAFAAYWWFGLVYTGDNRDVLLLPLYVIYVLWMSYAVLAFSEWLGRATGQHPRIGRYVAIALYGGLPLLMLVNILR